MQYLSTKKFNFFLTLHVRLITKIKLYHSFSFVNCFCVFFIIYFNSFIFYDYFFLNNDFLTIKYVYIFYHLVIYIFSNLNLDIKKILGNFLFSHSLSSAFSGLTSVFGMGTGVPRQLSLPRKYFFRNNSLKTQILCSSNFKL